MSRHNTILAQAAIAVAQLVPRISHAVARAGAGDDHDETIRRLRMAVHHAKELLTRLEVAELELAAQPIEQQQRRPAA